MNFGLEIPTTKDYADPHKLAELAVQAEDAGWDGFFVWDAILSDDPILNPWITLAAIASHTKTIRIGALMTALPRRHPWQVARETVTLDLLSNGRLIFGAGLGYQSLDYTAFGQEADPKFRAERLDEGLEILTRLWSGEVFSFEGRHYSVKDVRFLPTPVQSPRIPVWMAGGWPHRRPLQKAARWDGTYITMKNQVTGEPLKSDEVKQIVAFIKPYVRHGGPFDVAIPGETPSDPHAAAQIVEPYALAGATWWIEYQGSRTGLEDFRDRIKSGPPKLAGR